MSQTVDLSAIIIGLNSSPDRWCPLDLFHA